MELNMIEWIQSFSTPALDRFFIGVTMLGEEYFYIVLLSFFYWCINKEVVKYLVFVLTFSSVINGALKEIINSPRPFETLDIRALRVETAHGSSFPSGHTQTVAAFYSAVAIRLRSKFVGFISGILMVLVAISRVYLGVHWPKDVLVAIVLGCFVAWLVHKIFELEKKRGSTWPYLIITVSVLLSLFFFSTETYIKAAAAFLGFMMGIVLEENYVNFDVRASFGIQTLKFVTGIVITLAIFEGLKLILPQTLVFIGLRYFMTLFTVVTVIPWIFVKLRWSTYRIF